MADIFPIDLDESDERMMGGHGHAADDSGMVSSDEDLVSALAASLAPLCRGFDITRVSQWDGGIRLSLSPSGTAKCEINPRVVPPRALACCCLPRSLPNPCVATC